MVKFTSESGKPDGSAEFSEPAPPEASSVSPKESKSLRDQLKAHALKKQRDFNEQVKERESFNRLSQDELAFFQSLRDRERQQEDELNGFLEKRAREFDRRKKSLHHKTSSVRVEKKPRKLKLSKRPTK